MSATYKKHRNSSRQSRTGYGDLPSGRPDLPARGGGRWRGRFWLLIVGISVTLSTASRSAGADSSVPALPQVTAGDRSNRVGSAYIEWRQRLTRDQTNGETAWRFAKACFERADFSTNDTERAALAGEGIAASRHAIELDTNSAAGYFYLGVNLGQLARTKLFTALGLLDEMEVAWEHSIAIDPKFHFAAAERSLGLLYMDAPGWPLSLGSRSKARRHLQRATKLAPDYPENHLCWLEAQLKWGDTSAVKSQLATVEATLSAARNKITGPESALDWEDWDARWKRIKARAAESSAARSPRGSN